MQNDLFVHLPHAPFILYGVSYKRGKLGGGVGGGSPLVRFTDQVTNHGCQTFISVSSHIISMLSFFFNLVVRVSEKQLEKGILRIKEY